MTEPTAAHLRLKMGELTTAELRLVRAGYRLGWFEAMEHVRRLMSQGRSAGWLGVEDRYDQTEKGRELLQEGPE
jgi:hypothetical protein